MSVKKTSDKVLILGTMPSWKKAPLKDKTWEVWGMNAFWDPWGKYATRWFEIHPISIMEHEGWKYYKWLTKCPIPVYMKKHYANIPSSIPYPMEIAKPYMRQFSSTFCYQMALAIHEGFKTIGIYGVDFRNGTLRERFVEWPGLLYWIGVATGKGIKVQLPDDALSHPYLYGLDYWRELDYSRSRVLHGILKILKAYTDGADDRWRGK